MTDAAFSAFATALRQARQARSLSIPEVAKALLLSDSQIVGLEADHFGAFYTAAYAERAARRYAEYLGVSLNLQGAPQPDFDIGARHDSPTLTPRHLAAVDMRQFQKRAASKVVSGGVAGIAALVITGITWSLRRPAPPPAESSPPAASAEVPRAPVAGNSADAPNAQKVVSSAGAAPLPDDFDHRFYLVVTREVAINATDANGTVLLRGRQPQDPGRRIVGTPPFNVVVSDEGSAEIYYRGQRIRPGPTVYDGIAVKVDK